MVAWYGDTRLRDCIQADHTGFVCLPVRPLICHFSQGSLQDFVSHISLVCHHPPWEFQQQSRNLAGGDSQDAIALSSHQYPSHVGLHVVIRPAAFFEGAQSLGTKCSWLRGFASIVRFLDLSSRFINRLIISSQTPTLLPTQQNTQMRSAKAVVSEKLARIGPSATMSTAQRQPAYTTTSLKRWSVANKTLPGVFLLLSQI